MKLVAVLVMAAALGGLGAETRLIEGNPTSSVRVVIYEDLQCPDCASFRRMMDDRILPRYGSTVALEHRDFPLAKHAWARRAAVAARFFQEVKPDLGIQFRKLTLAKIGEITAANLDGWVIKFAAVSKVDPEEARAALEDRRLADLVEKDVQEGVARGVARTPTVFVNGQPFVETFTFEEISKAIDAALNGDQTK